MLESVAVLKRIAVRTRFIMFNKLRDEILRDGGRISCRFALPLRFGTSGN